MDDVPPRPEQFILPQPTLVVAFHTSCVKCPVAALNSPFGKSYVVLSFAHASTAAVALA
jgi:hypothetical protein